MTDMAIVDAKALSVMYFFMDKSVDWITEEVWAMTDKPPKQIIPVTITREEFKLKLQVIRAAIPVVVSKKPVKSALGSCGTFLNCSINADAILKIRR